MIDVEYLRRLRRFCLIVTVAGVVDTEESYLLARKNGQELALGEHLIAHLAEHYRAERNAEDDRRMGAATVKMGERAMARVRR